MKKIFMIAAIFAAMTMMIGCAAPVQDPVEEIDTVEVVETECDSIVSDTTTVEADSLM